MVFTGESHGRLGVPFSRFYHLDKGRGQGEGFEILTQPITILR
jgi:hypothetical protein